MRKGFWRHIKNLKNKMIFGHYGRDVYIQSGVSMIRPGYISIGDHVTIGKNTEIYVHPSSSPRRFLIEIGNYVHIGSYNIIGARHGIVLEDYVLIGPHVMIGDHSHRYEEIDVPIKFQGLTQGGPIRIERGCWIGANVFILPNVTIGRQSVVGANSVVNRDIPPYSVAVGAPARVVKRYDFEGKAWVKVNE